MNGRPDQSRPTRRALSALLAGMAVAPRTAFAAQGVAPAGSQGFDTARVVAAVRSFAASTNLRLTPGVSAAVYLPGDRVVTGVAGWADPERRIRMTPATRLMSGSTGKTFCAATAMTLVQDGVLNLDAPLAPIFRDEPWFSRLPNARYLTLRMLLTHGEGWPQFLDDPDFQATYLADSLAGRSVAYSPRKMLSFILDKKPLNAPGAKHHYTDLGYHMVGVTMEKVTGRPYYDLMRDRVMSRLTGHDIIPSNRRDIPGLAPGYARGDLINALQGLNGRTLDSKGALRRDPSLEYTGGGLALTPRALAQFFWKLANGQIVTPASFYEMTHSTMPDPVSVPAPGVSNAYGLGLSVTVRPEYGTYVSHSGYFPGYTSNVAYYLDHGFAAAVQQNTDHGPDIYAQLKALARAVIATKA